MPKKARLKSSDWLRRASLSWDALFYPPQIVVRIIKTSAKATFILTLSASKGKDPALPVGTISIGQLRDETMFWERMNHA